MPHLVRFSFPVDSTHPSSDWYPFVLRVWPQTCSVSLIDCLASLQSQVSSLLSSRSHVLNSEASSTQQSRLQTERRGYSSILSAPQSETPYCKRPSFTIAPCWVYWIPSRALSAWKSPVCRDPTYQRHGSAFYSSRQQPTLFAQSSRWRTCLRRQRKKLKLPL